MPVSITIYSQDDRVSVPHFTISDFKNYIDMDIFT